MERIVVEFAKHIVDMHEENEDLRADIDDLQAELECYKGGRDA